MPSETSSKKSSKPPKKKIKKIDSASKNGKAPLSSEFVTNSDQEGESDSPPQETQQSTSSQLIQARASMSPALERRRPSYEPPQGFRLMSKLSGANPFSPENLENKKLFIFTAPSTTSISDVATASLPLQPGPDGCRLIQSNAGEGRRSYTVRKEEEDAPTLNILLPDGDHNCYVRSRHKISAQFTISETPPLDKISLHGTNKTSGVTMRPQPPGLRMRFQPSGWGNDAVLDEEGYGLDDDDDARERNRYKPHSNGKQLPSDDEENPSVVEKEKPKHSSHHRRHDRHHDKESVDGASEKRHKISEPETYRKRQKTKRHEGETPEERKARKEQKRLKKEKKKE